MKTVLLIPEVPFFCLNLQIKVKYLPKSVKCTQLFRFFIKYFLEIQDYVVILHPKSKIIT